MGMRSSSAGLLALLLCLAGSAIAQETDSMNDAFALVKFRQYIFNDTFYSLKNWYLGLDSQTACNWTGVQCNAAKRVITVSLSGLYLVGGVSSALGELSELSKLDLSRNSFMGVIPPSLGNCKKLTELNLGHNSLAADIIPEIGRLPLLKILYLNNNNFYGPLPDSFSKLTKLTRLAVSGNKLSGYPFETLSGLQYLEFIDLGSNRFRGAVLNQSVVNWPKLQVLQAGDNSFDRKLPSTVGNLTQMQIFDISGNSIPEGIPPEIGNCTALTLFNASFNRMSGAVPSALGATPLLTDLDLRGNVFSSGIPTASQGYSSLQDMRLSFNNFSSIPDGMTSLPSIFFIDISKNVLQGNIPETLGTMSKLRFLNLSYNRLSATMPSQLSGATSLEVLDLSHNQLEDKIPYTIIKLNSLQTINLAFNRLVGRLPEELGSLTQLVEMDLSDNGLVGTIPLVLGNLPDLAVLDLSNNKLSGRLPANLEKGYFPASAFAGNIDLCGTLLNRSCLVYLGRTVGPGGMMVSAAGLVLSMIFVMVTTWWLCCRSDVEGKLSRAELGAWVIRRYPAATLVTATDGFIPQNFIGETRLCSVYKGELPNNQAVAVKVMRPEFYDGDRRSFAVEAKMLVKVVHPNIVKVLGCCNCLSMVALVLQLIPKGSLEDHLFADAESCELDWLQRLDIALSVAEALAYLHHEWESIIACDLKAGSILLDNDYRAYISNCRLASNKPRDSPGHWAPEYTSSEQQTQQGDVYSYGVFLLELLTRISPDGEIVGHGGLANWVKQSYPDTVTEIIDPELLEDPPHHQSVLQCTDIAMQCTREAPHERPGMFDIVQMLQKTRRSKELADLIPGAVSARKKKLDDRIYLDLEPRSRRHHRNPQNVSLDRSEPWPSTDAGAQEQASAPKMEPSSQGQDPAYKKTPARHSELKSLLESGLAGHNNIQSTGTENAHLDASPHRLLANDRPANTAEDRV